MRSGHGLAGWAATSVALALAGTAAAQAPAAAGADDVMPAAAGTDNVTPYEPAFFAEYRPVTALDMIGRIPGFQFDGGTSARGFAGTAGNVLIDGERPVTRSDSLATILSRIPASQVLRIEVIRGGAGGIDMQGKAMVANVIRTADAGVSGSASAGLSFTDQGRWQPSLSIQGQRQRGGRSMDGSLRWSGASLESNSVRQRFAPDGSLLLIGLEDSEISFQSAEATGVYEGPLAGGRLRANALFSQNDSVFEGTETLIRPGGQEDSRSDSLRRRGEAGLRWTRSLPRGMHLELVGFQSVTDNESLSAFDTPLFTARVISDQLSGETIGSGALKFAPLETGLGEIGLETRSELAFNWVESATAYTFDDSPLPLPGDDTRVEELRSESSITATWAARTDLNIQADLRYELSRIIATGSAGEGETSLQFLKPRLVATWTPAPRNTLTFRFERTVDQLSFGAFTASAAFSTGIYGRGNPDIRPAQTWLSSVRYERLFGTQGSFVAEYAHEDMDDILGSVVVVEVPTGGGAPQSFNITRNVGGATRDKVSLAGRLPLDEWGLEGGLFSGQVFYRWSDTTDPVTFEGRRLSGEQASGWSASLSQNLVAQRISWSVSVSSGSEGRSFGPSFISDFRSRPTGQLSLTYRPDARLSVSGGLFIASDSESDFTLFGAPRNIGAPLYTEVGRHPGSSQIYLSVRRSF